MTQKMFVSLKSKCNWSEQDFHRENSRSTIKRGLISKKKNFLITPCILVFKKKRKEKEKKKLIRPLKNPDL